MEIIAIAVKAAFFGETSPDFIVTDLPDDIIKVDIIRTLSKEMMLKPVSSKRRVFIINDADKMNESAQNALLKILEEPPTFSTIILICSNIDKIINTIRSRVTKIDFHPLSFEEFKEVLKDYDISKEDYIYSRGSIGKYLKLKDDYYLEAISKFGKVINSKDLIEMNTALLEIKEDSNIKDKILDLLDLIIINIGNDLIENKEKKIAQIEAIEEIRENIKRNGNFDTQLDFLMIKLWEINKRY